MKRMLYLLGLLWGIISCSDPVAGGSIATDNPTFAIQVQDQYYFLDTLCLRVWASHQNFILEPIPRQSKVLLSNQIWTLSADSLNAADSSWNIQVDNSTGQTLVVSGLGKNSNGEIIWLSNQEIVDTLILDMTLARSLKAQSQIPQKTDGGIPDIPISDSLNSIDLSLIRYAVILGTGLIQPITQDSITWNGLSSGNYTIGYTDSLGNILIKDTLMIP